MALLAEGCASPGPPRAPSLQLPALVTDLQATRRAGVVELEFAVPARTSDGLAYRGASVKAKVCRAVDAGACVPVASLTEVAVTTNGTVSAAGTGTDSRAKMEDVLPASLAAGTARLLTYRVELSNEKGRTAGFGDAAFAAAGAFPEAVAGLRAEGSRRGVAVRWTPGSGASEVVIRRELVAGTGTQDGASASGVSKVASGASTVSAGQAGRRKDTNGQQAGRPGRAQPAKGEAKEPPGVVWLSTVPEGDPLAAAGENGGETPTPGRKNDANGVLDDSAAVGGTYRYAAERRETVQLGGHRLVLRGVLSAPVEVTLRAVYPPPAPTDLVGTVFPLAERAGLAVDLIWTPADDPGTVGYKVFREVDGARTMLTKEPVRTPAFHDVLPPGLTSGQLRYGVVAVDARGMESPATMTVVAVGR